MQDYPLVTIITPYTIERMGFLASLSDMIGAQDYPHLEWLPDMGDGSVGEKRNRLCAKAKGDIIIHFDSDDIYAPDWITKSVEALINSKGNCTGLSKAFFKHGEQWYLYQAQENAQPYVCGATMCYYKSLWERNPFNNTNRGEDLQFQTNAIVRPHNHIDGFTATIHGDNIAAYSKILSSKEFTKITPAQPVSESR